MKAIRRLRQDESACLLTDLPEHTGCALCDECLRNINGKLTSPNQVWSKFNLNVVLNTCDGFIQKDGMGHEIVYIDMHKKVDDV
jgi:hypothetical protein